MNFFFGFRTRYLLYFALLAGGFILVDLYNQKETEKRAEVIPVSTGDSSGIDSAIVAENRDPVLKEGVVCLDVHDGEPLLPKSLFSRNVDYLFCHTRFARTTPLENIRHVWVCGDSVVARREMTTGVLSTGWSQFEMLKTGAGEWRVDVVAVNTGKDSLLGTIRFQLE
jgi:hypothetical protein